MSPMIEDFEAKQSEEGQQVMPEDGVAPDFGRVKADFERAVNDNTQFFDQCKENHDTRYAIWSGQSSDGKKHGRDAGSMDVTPWDGSSDLRCYVADSVIASKVAQSMVAYKRANIAATPIEGGDYARARTVTNFLRWLIFTQIEGLDREIELLLNYRYEKGIAITGQFWETCREKTLQAVKIEDVEAIVEGATQYIQDKTLEDEWIKFVRNKLPDISVKKAQSMVRELRDTGKTSFPIVSREYSKPVLRTFTLDEDIFIHPSATDIQSAPGIYRVQYYTPAQMRSLVVSDGWDAEWVEDAIAECIDREITILPGNGPAPVARDSQNETDKHTGLIGVVYAYEKLSDEDGVPGVYLSVFNPDMPAAHDGRHNGFASFGLLGYAHGKYPFVPHRLEHLSRRLHDTRGVPEIAKGYQDIIKAMRDSGIDAASLSVIPPLLHPKGKAPTRWGPGSRIGVGRGEEYKYADRPVFDNTRVVVEQEMQRDLKEYFGLGGEGVDPQDASFKQQKDTTSLLSSLAEAFEQIWSLYKQYGKDDVYFRVIGASGKNMEKFQKGDAREEYDIYLTFDPASVDLEKQKEKYGLITQIVQTADRNGQVDHAEFLPWAVEAIDPTAAERFILPKDAGIEKFVSEEQSDLVKLANGFDVDIKLGSPAELGMQVMQNWVQAPDIQQKLAQDEVFRERVEKRLKQYNMQLQQEQNKKIGRYGA
jgi:hypothetical protein